MTNIKVPILSLPPANALDGTELVPIVQGGTTKKVPSLFMIGVRIRGYYADNDAAIAAGLAVGDLYKTAEGDVRIVVSDDQSVMVTEVIVGFDPMITEVGGHFMIREE